MLCAMSPHFVDKTWYWPALEAFKSLDSSSRVIRSESKIAHAGGEAQLDVLRRDPDLHLDFRGSRVICDTGLSTCRKLDGAFGLMVIAGHDVT